MLLVGAAVFSIGKMPDALNVREVVAADGVGSPADDGEPTDGELTVGGDTSSSTSAVSSSVDDHHGARWGARRRIRIGRADGSARTGR